MARKLRTLATFERQRTAARLISHRVTVHILLLCSLLNVAITEASESASGPVPPCPGSSARNVPEYSEPNAQPQVGVWRDIVLNAADSCLGTLTGRFELVVALAGRFETSESLEEIAERIGSVSAIRGLKYWSITDEEWRPLSTNAFAVRDVSESIERGDFSAAEVLSGDTLFFSRDGSRSTGQALYAAKAIASSEDSLVLETHNVTSIQMLLFTLFEADELRSVHYLRRDAGNRWNYYGLTAVRTQAVFSDERSFINRAAAYFRHLAGQRADGASPLAP
ncbi:MAG: hypothetical protein ACI9DC_001189 [Gammaproteobacteria bacterium]|jgi:hypothetical protein